MEYSLRIVVEKGRAVMRNDTTLPIVVLCMKELKENHFILSLCSLSLQWKHRKKNINIVVYFIHNKPIRYLLHSNKENVKQTKNL
jgi:hypothetical protein